jgi:hypothetical protein
VYAPGFGLFWDLGFRGYSTTDGQGREVHEQGRHPLKVLASQAEVRPTLRDSAAHGSVPRLLLLRLLPLRR